MSAVVEPAGMVRVRFEMEGGRWGAYWRVTASKVMEDEEVGHQAGGCERGAGVC